MKLSLKNEEEGKEKFHTIFFIKRTCNTQLHHRLDIFEVLQRIFMLDFLTVLLLFPSNSPYVHVQSSPPSYGGLKWE